MILLLLNVGTVCAQVKPDDFIAPNNASKVKDFVSPGVFYKVPARDDNENRPDPI